MRRLGLGAGIVTDAWTGPETFSTTYQFTLSLPSYRNGKYLTGTSTNYNGGRQRYGCLARLCV